MNRLAVSALALLVGLPLAALSCMLAVGLAGAGHGWITPLVVSLGGVLLYPIAVALAVGGRWVPREMVMTMLVLAMLSDAYLLGATLSEGAHYFVRTAPYNWVWIGLWSLWQWPVLFRLVADGRPEPGA